MGIIEDQEDYRQAVLAWYRKEDPQLLIGYLRGRLQSTHDKYWEIRRENTLLAKENGLLRGEGTPDDVSWVMRKIDEQRREIVSLRQRLGYRDRQGEPL